MSEAEPDIDDVDALLSEVLAADMALLRHVNAQALAATEPDVLNGYVRSQQRLARSVRTTLTTRARLLRERDQDVARAAPATPRPGDAGSSAALREQQEMEDAVEARVRLEYDRAEAEEIDHDIGLLVEEVWEDEAYAELSHEARIEAVMALVRKQFGPPKAPRTPKPAAEAEPPEPEPPAPEPPPPEPPPAPAPEPPEEGYIPPWDRRPPGAIFRGGGSGW